MRRKKNRFLLFCCSLMPGAGEMYLGFMKMGSSIMVSFVLGMTFAGFSGLGILTVIPMVLWFYSFFNANNLGSMSIEELNNIEDNYLFIDEDGTNSIKALMAGKYRKVIAIVMILVGISMLWAVLCDALIDIFGRGWFDKYIYHISRMFRNNVPRIIIGILIIWFGVKMILGKKAEIDKLEDKEETYTSIESEKKDE